MKSVIVVTSWWSNCLGLLCLNQLVAHAPRRDIYVMQAGKSDRQMAYFRRQMPAGVTELHYPEHLPADDSRMREYLARELFADTLGVWFFDHDLFVEANCEPWLRAADRHFAEADACMRIGVPRNGPGVTQPAYWLSPLRLPDGLSTFDPIPFEPKPHARRPDLHVHSGELIRPEKDTLVQVADELSARGRLGTFPLTAAAAGPLPPFPNHIHIGGIHLYTGPLLDERFDGWLHQTVTGFEWLYATCPPAWTAIEDPELLRRHAAFREALRQRQAAGPIAAMETL